MSGGRGRPGGWAAGSGIGWGGVGGRVRSRSRGGIPAPIAAARRMVTDVQLAIFANMLGVSLFLLVVLYHYVAVNNPKRQE